MRLFFFLALPLFAQPKAGKIVLVDSLRVPWRDAGGATYSQGVASQLLTQWHGISWRAGNWGSPVYLDTTNMVGGRLHFMFKASRVGNIMAQIILNIPDNQLQRVVDGVCSYYGYSATLIGGTPNPETKNQFAKRMLVEQTEIWVATIEGKTADKTAYDSAISQLLIT